MRRMDIWMHLRNRRHTKCTHIRHHKDMLFIGVRNGGEVDEARGVGIRLVEWAQCARVNPKRNIKTSVCWILLV